MVGGMWRGPFCCGAPRSIKRKSALDGGVSAGRSPNAWALDATYPEWKRRRRGQQRATEPLEVALQLTQSRQDHGLALEALALDRVRIGAG